MFSCLILPFVQIFLFFTLQQSSANKFSLMHSHLHFRRKCKFSSWCECIKAFTPIVFLFLFIIIGVNALAFTPIVFLFLFLIIISSSVRFLTPNYSFILCAISTILIPKCSACSGDYCYDFL